MESPPDPSSTPTETAAPRAATGATPAERRAGMKRYLVRTAIGFLILILLGLAAVWLGYSRLKAWSERPVGAEAEESVELRIERGSSLPQIAATLEQRGLIDNADYFRAWAILEKKHDKLQAGEYTIALPATPEQVLAKLQHGMFLRKLTIPEGWTSDQVAAQLAKQGFIEDEQAWRDLVARPVPAEILGFVSPEGAEGFLFPDTYLLDEDAAPEAILSRMLNEFARVWQDLDTEMRDDRSADLTPREVVTLASMIQREARSEVEMPAIASVYLNRLERRMRLQCCATIHFALGQVWDRPLRYADLEIDSPYNTYKHYGLPPGPIGNPGRAALAAVLRPAETDYLFYVYRGDGTHEFTKTYAEHMKAARKFRQADPNASLARKNGKPAMPADIGS